MQKILATLCVLLVASRAAAFKEAFEPGNSTHFLPEESTSFAVVPSQVFFLGYADNTHLKGYQGKDWVQLGDYYSYARFGAITDCNSPDFNHVDGILGFGLPVAHPAMPPSDDSSGGGGGGGGGGLGGAAGALGGGGFGSMIPGMKMPGGLVPHATKPTLPPPLLFSLTHTPGTEERLKMKKEAEQHKGQTGNYIHRRAFSFLSSDNAAELQLGGYDPESIEGHMFLTPSISASDYVTVGLSLKYGTEELLDFTTSNPRLAYLPAIMDSGTSCLVIPDSTLGGLLKDKPYSKWKSMVNNTAWPSSKESFFLNIAGASFEIPYDDWFLAQSNQSCIQRTPKGFSGILVGDVLFRRYLVLFDLTQFEEGRVLIGIAKQNKNYVPATHPIKVNTLHKVPLGKQAGTPQGEEKQPRTTADGKTVGAAPPHLAPPMAMDRIPVVNKEDTQYFINVSIGTPRQEFTVIFDTGSAVFGIFSRCVPDAPTYGNCMFGGLKSQGSSLLQGVILVACVSIGCVLIGVIANVAVRRWHSKQEQSKLKQFKKSGKTSTSESAFGPERLYGSFGNNV